MTDQGNPFDLDKNKPLEERRNSTKEQRDSLIKKYKDINESELSYTLRSNRPSELSRAKKKKLKYIFIGVGILIVLAVILTVTLCITLRDNPNNPDPTPVDPVTPTENPYVVSATDNSLYGVKKLTISRDKSANSFSSQYVKETTNNKFVDNAVIAAQIQSYSSINLRIADADNATYEVGSQFKNQDTSKTQGLNFNDIGFAIDQVSTSSASNSASSTFNIRIFDKDTQQEFLNTYKQNFYLMSQYQEMSFMVNSQRLSGLGERLGSFYMKNGTYILYPQNNSTSQEDAPGYGQHPFIMMQLNNTNYFGMYLMNSNPMQVDIQLNSAGNQTLITFRTVGGVLDFHFFYGPYFQDVVRQYSDIIGKPKMIPLWAHGYFAKSVQFNDTDGSNATEAITKFKSNNFPLEGIALTVETLQGYKILGYKDLVKNIRASDSTVKLILPFSFMSVDAYSNSSLNQSFAVQALGKDLVISVMENGKSISGYCMDVFNPLIGTEYIKNLMGKEDVSYQGYWLENNIPSISSSDVTNNSTNNPFYDLPFIPGNMTLFNQTLPGFSQHRVASDKLEYHFNTHAAFGSQMAMQFVKNIPETEQSKGVVFTESTFPGLGQYGVAHVLQRQSSSYEDLHIQLGNMVKFGMFGIPNVGPVLCGQTADTSAEQSLCARYYQLSVVSPLAFSVSSMNTLSTLPYNFEDTYKQSIVSSLKQRMQYLIYMRTELFKIEKNGGSLLRPVVADYPLVSSNNLNITDFQTVMFGQVIKAEFSFVEDQIIKEVFFPDTKWIDLNTLEPLTDISAFTRNISVGFDHVNLYQSGEKSIIAYQNTTKHAVTKIEDLQNVPISISIALDTEVIQQGAPLNYQAFGQILIEDGIEERNQVEFYEVQVSNRIIAFKQQNSGICTNDHVQIEQIAITFLESEINFACALKNDLKTVQPLYVASYNSTRRQAIIQPNDPNNTADTSTIKINQLAFVFYGYSANSLTCNTSLFQMKGEVVQNDSYVFSAKLTPNMSQIYTYSNMPTINITLLSDNSLHIVQSTYSHLDGYFDTPTDIFDRNFTLQNKTAKAFNMTDILVVNLDPFYFEIVNPYNKTQVLLSTKDQFIFQMTELNIFNYIQPSANSERFFGIGERTGNFFLQDKHTYSLYNNQNNVKKDIQSERVVEYGMNGFYPIIYSEIAEQSNLTAVVMFTVYGQEISFDKQSTVQNSGPRVSIQHASDELEFAFIFNLTALKAVEAVFDHIQLGTLLIASNMTHTLPPPEWALGTNIIIKNQDDVNSFITKYRNDTQWALDGIILDLDSLDADTSFALNKTRFTTDVLTELKNKGIAIYTISKAGFSTSGNSTSLTFIQDNDMAIVDDRKTSLTYESYYSYDESGQIIYADYSVQQSATLIDQLISNFTSTYSGNYGVQLKNNEISREFCQSGSCINDDFFYRDLFRKPGCTRQTINTLGTSYMNLGIEDSLHNVDALMEQMAYANYTNHSRIPVISESTSMGSGRLGFVARSMSNYQLTARDINVAIGDIQRMSILGMPLVGASFSNDNVDVVTKEKLSMLALRTFILNAFSPITIQNAYPEITNLTSNFTSYYKLANKLRYMMMKYTRTQLFKSVNYGTPLIRPLFFDSNETEPAIAVLNDQYQYGPSFMYSYNFTINTTFPPGQWCPLAVTGINSNLTCVTSNVTTIQNITDQGIFIKQGTITPLQDVYQTDLFNSSTDLQTLALDLHIHNTNDTLISSGEILIDSVSNTKGTDYCYLSLDFATKVLTLTDKSDTMGGSGTCQYSGFNLGKIYLYQGTNQTITKAQIEGQTDEMTLETKDHVQVFTSKTVLFIKDVKTVTFS